MSLLNPVRHIRYVALLIALAVATLAVRNGLVQMYPAESAPYVPVTVSGRTDLEAANMLGKFLREEVGSATEIEQAMAIATANVRRNPLDESSYLLAAYALRKRGDSELADPLAAVALDHDPRNLAARFWAVGVAERQGEIDSVFDHIGKIALRRPTAAYLLGGELASLMNLPRAVGPASTALAKKPLWAQGFLEKAIKDADPDEVVRLVESMLRQNPESLPPGMIEQYIGNNLQRGRVDIVQRAVTLKGSKLLAGPAIDDELLTGFGASPVAWARAGESPTYVLNPIQSGLVVRTISAAAPVVLYRWTALPVGRWDIVLTGRNDPVLLSASVTCYGGVEATSGTSGFRAAGDAQVVATIEIAAPCAIQKIELTVDNGRGSVPANMTLQSIAIRRVAS